MSGVVWQADAPLVAVAGESRAANRALHDYARMGAGTRSLRGLLERYVQRASDAPQTGGELPPTTKWGTLTAWSHRHAWGARCTRFDELQRAAELAAYAKRRAEDQTVRIQALQAYRGKVLRAMQNLTPETAGWADVTAALRMVTEELRREFGDDVQQVQSVVTVAEGAAGAVAQLSAAELAAAVRNLVLAASAPAAAEISQEMLGERGGNDE